MIAPLIAVTIVHFPIAFSFTVFITKEHSLINKGAGVLKRLGSIIRKTKRLQELSSFQGTTEGRPDRDSESVAT